MNDIKILIDDTVRRSFPGMTDTEIEQFYRVGQIAAKDTRPSILATDLYLARIVRELGWRGLEAYLDAAVGDHTLGADDIADIADACAYLREQDSARLYSALYGSSSEASSRKTVTAREKGLERLTAPLQAYRIVEEV